MTLASELAIYADELGPDANENVLPIPKEELDISSDILKQNPGYFSYLCTL